MVVSKDTMTAISAAIEELRRELLVRIESVETENARLNMENIELQKKLQEAEKN
jgi:regulator of replication initiation timing